MRNLEYILIPKIPSEYAWQKMQSVFPNKAPKIHYNIFKAFSQLQKKWDKNELANLIFIDNDGKLPEEAPELNVNHLKMLFSSHFQSSPNIILVEHQNMYYVVNNEQTDVFSILDFQSKIKENNIELGFIPKQLQEVLDNFENEQHTYGWNCVIYQFDDTWKDSEVHEYTILLKNILLADN